MKRQLEDIAKLQTNNQESQLRPPTTAYGWLYEMTVRHTPFVSDLILFIFLRNCASYQS